MEWAIEIEVINKACKKYKRKIKDKGGGDRISPKMPWSQPTAHISWQASEGEQKDPKT